MNQQTLSGHWRQLRGKLQANWGELTDDELDHVEGNVDQLVGLLQQKTGETRESIERQLDAMCDETDDQQTKGETMSAKAQQYVEQASDNAKHLAEGVAQSVQQSSEYVGDAVRHRYQETGELVRTRPVESLAITFGAGVAAGVLVGLLLRRR